MSTAGKKKNRNYNSNKKRVKIQDEMAKEQLQEVLYEDLTDAQPLEEDIPEEELFEIVDLDEFPLNESEEYYEEPAEEYYEDSEEEYYEESEEEYYEDSEEEYYEEPTEEYYEDSEDPVEEPADTIQEVAEVQDAPEVTEPQNNEDVIELWETVKVPEKKSYKKLLLIPAIILAIALVSIITIFIYEKCFIYTLCRVEAGIDVAADDFLKKERVRFTDAGDEIDVTVPGEYNLIVNIGLFNSRCKLIVEDTTAPVVNLVPLTVEFGQTCEVTDFVESIDDATQTTIAYESEPDFSLKGEQAVKIVVTDAGGNTTVAETRLMISAVVSVLDVEIGGEAPEVADFVISGDNAELVTDISTIDYSVLGSHEVEVSVDGMTHKVTMNIIDTVAPVVQVKDISGFLLVQRNAEDFVTSGEDATEITYSFETQPDFTVAGTQDVVVVATDEGGNQTKNTVKLTLENDTEAPVITKADDMVVIIGNSVSYKANVKAEDNCPDGLEIIVDSSAVNLNEVGTYPVTYTAKDLAGNTTSVTVNLTVKEQTYDIETVNALCDQVLAQIITDGMSQRDKAQAIYNYTRSHVSYISYSEKGNYVQAAYEGLAEGKGDCYVFACVSKVLLTRAGITNMDIEKIRVNNTMHFWNLVDIGDGWGWYHYDTTPRKDGTKFFLWTDAPLRAYSDSHNDSHNYDPALYPTINP